MGIQQSRVKEFLAYDEMTGIFTWKKKTANRANRIKIGAVAGALSPTDGYWRIKLDGQRYAAHRLAWVYVHGAMPPADIDHINGDRLDNRLANLRLATRAENLRNSRPRKSGILKGTHLNKRRDAAALPPWTSRIYKDGKTFNLGFFDTAEDAHAAYAKAARELFGEFARTA
jgi:hypothetical protein